jgi:tetratricopeptide (TPR) repeat protein
MRATSLERGLVLFDLGHFARAEKEFLASLQDTPDRALAYTMLAMCMINTKKRREALEFAKQALQLEPELSYAHYVLAYCYARSSQLRLAMPAITEALRLDPQASEYWAFKAYLHLCAASKFTMSEAKHALESAEQGLSCNPHDAQCMQLKARALLALNRKSEAFNALKSALAIDPIDADSHELRAWLALEGGQSVEAREFYAEALRLNPGSASARTGLLSAMRAKHLIYRFG